MRTSAQAVREWSIVTKALVIVFNAACSALMVWMSAVFFESTGVSADTLGSILCALLFGFGALYVLWHSLPSRR
jgi:hypothetical protein